MIHGVFISKKRKRERIYFQNMREFLEYAIHVWDDLEFLSADTVRVDQIRQGRNAKYWMPTPESPEEET